MSDAIPNFHKKERLFLTNLAANRVLKTSRRSEKAMSKTETNGSTNPDAEQYARVMLWHLSSIQAALQLMATKTIQESGEQAGTPQSEILKEIANYGKNVRKLSEVLYQNALEQANIKPSPKLPYPAGS